MGTDRVQAYLRGWELYYGAMESKDQPSAAVNPYSVSWAAGYWRKSDEFNFKASGEPKSPKTLQYQEDWLKVIEARIGQRDLRALEKKHVKGWKQELQKQGHPAKTAAIMKVLRMFYNFCIGEGWYKQVNPASKIKIHVPKKSGYVPWTWPRVKEFYKAACDAGRPNLGLAVAMIYDSGQNPVDVLRTERDRSRDNQVVALYHSDVPIYRSGRLDLSRSKTAVGADIPLQAWVTRKIDKLPHDTATLIVSEETGKPYTLNNFRKWVRLICRRAGLPDELKAGNLRHEAGQEAEDGGASPEEIQGLLAHSEPGTQRFYVKRTRADEAQKARARTRRKRRTK
ncbi:hypothetical protein HBA54_03090 [Pelagibius litoralis]|uniref:Tyr recombinase domain-containing protein n=1 Tax=Pelagibius litoralis TaxID=374515 RepID=A0A967C739_9PROT|nr:tyrosine-type recombinase/integrase [Pelagibius litoralis]NIA67567.1 hypothetical protein [Pelagibius litoralis]